MWEDLEETRAKAIIRARRAAQAARKRNTLQYKRVAIDVVLNPNTPGASRVSSQILLNEITPNGMFLSVPSPVATGTVIQLALPASKTDLHVIGKVRYCKPVVLERRIISDQNFGYRVYIDFYIVSHKDKVKLEQYHQELQVHHLGVQNG